MSSQWRESLGIDRDESRSISYQTLASRASIASSLLCPAEGFKYDVWNCRGHAAQDTSVRVVTTIAVLPQV